jgi:hypothetical protein
MRAARRTVAEERTEWVDDGTAAGEEAKHWSCRAAERKVVRLAEAG